jgi:hypothetical protein
MPCAHGVEDSCSQVQSLLEILDASERARLLAEERANRLEARFQQAQKMDIIGRLAGGWSTTSRTFSRS